MVSAVSVSVLALNAGIGSSIGIGLKCGIGTSLVNIHKIAISYRCDQLYFGWRNTGTNADLIFASICLTQGYPNFLFMGTLWTIIDLLVYPQNFLIFLAAKLNLL